MSATQATVAASLNGALARLLEEDERVLVFGEDVVDPYGGAFKVTRGLSTRWPDRVWSTPISEASIVGVGTGLALAGFRPIVEIMFGDFVTLCMDQLVNTAAKLPLMFGDVSVPLVVRTPMGGHRGYGPTHSQTLEKMLLGIPGLTVLAPSLCHDAGDILIRSVQRTREPVLFVENKTLYSMSPGPPRNLALQHVDDAESGYPLAVLQNYAGDGEPDVAVFGYGGMSVAIADVLTTLADDEVRCRGVLPARLDTGLTSAMTGLARASGGVVVCDEATAGFGWASELAAGLAERGVRHVRRVESLKQVIPAARDLEAAMLVTPDRIRREIVDVLFSRHRDA